MYSLVSRESWQKSWPDHTQYLVLVCRDYTIPYFYLYEHVLNRNHFARGQAKSSEAGNHWHSHTSTITTIAPRASIKSAPRTFLIQRGWVKCGRHIQLCSCLGIPLSFHVSFLIILHIHTNTHNTAFNYFIDCHDANMCWIFAGHSVSALDSGRTSTSMLIYPTELPIPYQFNPKGSDKEQCVYWRKISRNRG